MKNMEGVVLEYRKPYDYDIKKITFVNDTELDEFLAENWVIEINRYYEQRSENAYVIMEEMLPRIRGKSYCSKSPLEGFRKKPKKLAEYY
jgi:hypothetical protein